VAADIRPPAVSPIERQIDSPIPERLSRTDEIRAFWRKIGNSIAALAGGMDAVPWTEVARGPYAPGSGEASSQEATTVSAICTHTPVMQANSGRHGIGATPQSGSYGPMGEQARNQAAERIR
jgi:hypothetical protein